MHRESQVGKQKDREAGALRCRGTEIPGHCNSVSAVAEADHSASSIHKLPINPPSREAT